MTLPAPIIDDRTFGQLSAELRGRIPVYAPEWTDHNESDPGIALLELFAYLGENLLFRFNQVPETTQMAFLRLLDIPLLPARAATGLITFSGTGQVPPATKARAGKVVFETLNEVGSLAVGVRTVGKLASELTSDLDEIDRVQLRLEALGATAESAGFYRVASVPDDPNVPDTEPVDFTLAVDHTVWIAVLAPDPLDELGRKQAIADLQAADPAPVLNLGVRFDEATAHGLDGAMRSPGAGHLAPNPPAFEWQATTGVVASGSPVFETVGTVSDSTVGMTTTGVIRIDVGAAKLGVPVPPSIDLAGTGTYPPELDDPDDTARILFWLRGFRPGPGPEIGRIAWVGVNAAGIVQHETAGAEYLGTGSGRADQRYALANSPIVAGSIRIEVEEAGTWVPYEVVDDFFTSTPEDRHVMVDLASAVVRFGSRRGRRPQLGERVRTRSYRFGGGVRGNLGPGSITKNDSPLRCSQPFATGGGQDTESVAAALERIPGEFRRRDRAVAASDFSELAQQTPGVSLARAEVLPRFHPETKQFETPGCVTVVVWPSSESGTPDRPRPLQSDLDAVCAYLDERRLVTTELYVSPPTYRSIAVSIGIAVEPGNPVQAVRQWVELAVRQYLAPVPPYGPSGGGWPLGRRVHGPELEAAALQVEGVKFLENLLIAETTGPTLGSVTTITLEPWEVVHVAAISVVEGTPLAPGSLVRPPPPVSAPVPIPIAPRSEC